MSAGNQSERGIVTSSWLTVTEAAGIAKVGKRVIYTAVKAGVLKASPVNERGDLRIAADWLDAWLRGLGEARNAGIVNQGMTT
jgi:excisionase family DNA binding protein